MEQDTINTLAIECAVGAGSIAVLRGISVQAESSDLERPSRAEEVLRVIRAALKRSGLTLGEIDRIVVSTGPGSYSGIRIGMATALGLGNALSIEPLGVSVLEALALDSGETLRLATAVAVGKRHTAWCVFDAAGGYPKRELGTDAEFLAGIATAGALPLHWSSDIASRLSLKLPSNIVSNPLRRSIAELIGVFATRFPDRTSMVPQYLREQQEANRVND